MLHTISEVKTTLKDNKAILIDMQGPYDVRKRFIYRLIRMGILHTSTDHNYLIVSLNR